MIRKYDNKYIGLITVRTSSSRLKKKCLLKFGNYKVVEHFIRRCLVNKIQPIVCTTRLQEDNTIVKISKKLKVDFFRGSEKNKIKRWYDCCKKFKIKYFHTIDADDVFFDPVAVKRSLNLCRKNYDVVFPSRVTREGGGSDGYSFSYKSIKQIYKNLHKFKNKINNLDTEMIEPFINKNKLKTIILKASKYETTKARLTLDYKEDYKMLCKIVKAKGNFSSREEINSFLKKNKYIIKINYHKTHDWKKKQRSFKLQV